jgi:hypothetical protein
MAAPTSYPSYAYNATQFSTVIVASAAAFNALPAPGVWTTTPYAGVGGIAPNDPGMTDTDIRLQQILIENRIQNQLLQFGFNLADDPIELRGEILANDSGLTS